ncbi:hypothetical protein HZS_6842, partial [Henneguya salminicola]
MTNSKNKKGISNMEFMFCGGIAGAIAKSITAPLDRIKIIIITNQKGGSYQQAKEIVRETVRTQGWQALWRGNSASLARIIPYSAGHFFLYENLKYIYHGDSESGLIPFTIASIVGLGSLAISYPFATVRCRMAVTGVERYNNIFDTFNKIYRQKGVKCFYRGFVPCLISIPPYSGLKFLVFELLKYQHKILYPNHPDPDVISRFLYGGVGGLASCLCSHPLDVIRNTFQTDGADGSPYKYKKLWPSFVSIYKKSGLSRGLYGGLSVNIYKTVLSNAIIFC